MVIYSPKQHKALLKFDWEFVYKLSLTNDESNLEQSFQCGLLSTLLYFYHCLLYIVGCLDVVQQGGQDSRIFNTFD